MGKCKYALVVHVLGVIMENVKAAAGRCDKNIYSDHDYAMEARWMGGWMGRESDEVWM
jgi:hypothetical protein